MPRPEFLAVLLALVVSTSALADDWPQWRGARRDGVWRGVRLPARLTEDSVETRWRVPIGGGYAGIAVVGQRVLTMDRPATGKIERVVCFDSRNGKVEWSHEYAADYGDLDHAQGPRATPTVERGRVFAVGTVGYVACLRLEDGAPVWTVDAATRLRAKQPIWGHAASPLLVDDLVILQLGARPKGTVIALDRRSGEERWRALDDRPGYSSPIVATIGGKRRLLVWTADRLWALDPATGASQWSVEFRTSNFDVAIISPVVCGPRVVLSGFWDGTRVFDASSDGVPRPVWQARQPSCLMATPLSRDGKLWALDRRNGFLCVEWATGRELWRDDYRLTPKERNPHASIVWVDDASSRAAGRSGLAVALNALGDLVLLGLGAERYEELGRVHIIDKTWAHPAFAGQEVFARDHRELVCVRIRAR